MLTQASNLNLNATGQFQNLSTITIASIVSAAVTVLFIVTALILFFVLIIGGISIIVGGSKGDTQSTERGQKAVTGALVGLVIVFGAYAIISLINIFFGLDILQLSVPTA